MAGHLHRTDHGETARYGTPPTKQNQARIRVIGGVFVLLMLAVGIRLTQLAVSPGNKLNKEEEFHIGEVAVRAPRGEILDRNGIVLATSRNVPSIWADPRDIVAPLDILKRTDPQELAMMLSVKLGLDENVMLDRLTRRGEDGKLMKFIWLERWLEEAPKETLDEIVAASKGGIAIEMEPIRYYPQGDTAAHLLGFVNRAGEASEGVERVYNDYLDAKPGVKRARKDGGRNLMDSLTLEYRDPVGGDELQLTLDVEIQHALEKTLDQRMVDCNAKAAMGILLDPYTGAILAMATRPAFDPNRYDEFPPELRKNRALIDVFEPGSSFKIVTASAVLEHALVTPDTMIDCEGGYYNPYGHLIKDSHKMGVAPFWKCFEESSNIAMIKLAAKLGSDRLDHWIRRFGFTMPTSKDFQFESTGLYPPMKKWSRLTMGSLPIGQEVAVTMVQLARAFGVICNGGYLIDPYFVERAIARDGSITYQHMQERRLRVLSDNTASTMRQLAYNVVLNGTGKPALIPEYKAGGKTGTAQIASPRGGYELDKYTAIFAGFAPVSNPRIVAVIIVQEPMIKLHYGGYVSGPVFQQVVRDALIRLNVPQEPVPPENGGPKPELLAKNEPIEEETDADTVVEHVKPEEIEESLNDLLEPMDGIALVAHSTAGDVGVAAFPDLMGMTKREAIDRLSIYGIPLDIQGVGWVVAQDPPAGTPINEVTLCALKLATKEEIAKQKAAEEEEKAKAKASAKKSGKKDPAKKEGAKKETVKKEESKPVKQETKTTTSAAANKQAKATTPQHEKQADET